MIFLETILHWATARAEWYEFWMPMSGFRGGVILAGLILYGFWAFAALTGGIR